VEVGSVAVPCGGSKHAVYPLSGFGDQPAGLGSQIFITMINTLHHHLGHIGEARLHRVIQNMGGNSRGQHLDKCSVYPGKANAASDQEWTSRMCCATCSEARF